MSHRASSFPDPVDGNRKLSGKTRSAGSNRNSNAFSLERLYGYFEAREGPVEELLPVFPESTDAVDVFARIFSRINSSVAPVFSPPGRAYSLAILVVEWMRGKSLSFLIRSRLEYFKKISAEKSLAVVIRSVMDDVEQIARFAAPRYVSCYIDVLRYHLDGLGRSDLAQQLPEVSLWLEFGASQQTQLSLMGLGLSRTTAVALSEYIFEDNLSEQEVLQKLYRLELISLDIPLAVFREASKLLSSRPESS